MTPTALLADLARRGITVTAAGAQLRVVPAGRLAEADRAALRQHKPALLALLSAGTATEDRSDRSDQRRCVACGVVRVVAFSSTRDAWCAPCWRRWLAGCCG
jgi:TubC N-terminal docking domain